ncbi:MAG: hypothetical protein Q9227_005586 [Pyrenula ochraceoflavens]
MAAIHVLLNPVLEDGDIFRQLPSPSSSVSVSDYIPPPPPRKKAKISKDAAIFARGNIRGECRFPPCEYQDKIIAAEHRKYRIHPIGHIAEFPRHIPYNSEKRSFLEATGRESFEVFQYEFRVPGDEKVYCMMWDYNIGLVRTTPLFRYLRNICHSITGGALAAQGYWVPFEAAQAVAATFCWNIRFALTPVFGANFPSMCVPPDSDKFGEMVIDPAITRTCTERAQFYRELELQSRASPKPSLLLRSANPTTPGSPNFTKFGNHTRRKRTHAIDSRFHARDEKDSDSNYQASAASSPSTSYRNTWTPTNTPRSIPNAHNYRLPSPQDIISGLPSPKNQQKRNLELEHEDNHPGPSRFDPSIPSVVQPRRAAVPISSKLAEVEEDEDYDGSESSEGDASEPDWSNIMSIFKSTDHESKAAVSTPSRIADEKAAYALMSLKMGRATLERGGERSLETGRASRKRRAST